MEYSTTTLLEQSAGCELATVTLVLRKRLIIAGNVPSNERLEDHEDSLRIQRNAACEKRPLPLILNLYIDDLHEQRHRVIQATTSLVDGAPPQTKQVAVLEECSADMPTGFIAVITAELSSIHALGKLRGAGLHERR